MTEQDYHILFRTYLMKKFEDDADEVASIMETAERILPQTFHDYFGTTYQSIYEIQDSEEVEMLRRKIKADPVLKGIDMNEEPRYTEVLKWYRLFVKSLAAHDGPIQVPGEYPMPEDETCAHKVAEGEPNNGDLTVEEGNKTQERSHAEGHERNPELRRLTIKVFKENHGGRVFCECCGFDFGIAYGEIGDEYIEVHHTKPFSQATAEAGGTHAVRVSDMALLCSNCHSMIHRVGRQGDCMSVAELKALYKGKTYNNN